MKNSLGLNKDPKDTKIVVAMSGGVDSSVVACMLKEQGYNVIGITLQLYDIGDALKKKNACCAGVDIQDAKNVADKMNFPHYVLNYQNLFKESVIDDFADSYLQGETPIPCIKCNQSVKFRDLMKVAHDLGAEALATGHYVRRVDENGRAQLHKAVDEGKDQSYFLFATTQEQLDFLHFPLGGFKKEHTRELAQKFGLTIANKPDSQDICFVPNGDYASVIAKHRPQAFKAGDLKHIETDEILGQHNGIINFTLGQRKGLGISYPEPLYVVKIEPKSNIVFVGEEKHLQNHRFIIRDCNWLVDFAKGKGESAQDRLTENAQNKSKIDGENAQKVKERASNENVQNNESFKIGETFQAKVRLRSAHKEESATIRLLPQNRAEITMKSMTRAITPGQACVIYDENRVLGGGWITKEID